MWTSNEWYTMNIYNEHTMHKRFMYIYLGYNSRTVVCWFDRLGLPVRPNDVVESLHVGLAGLRSGVEAVQLGSSEGRCSVKDTNLNRRILQYMALVVSNCVVGLQFVVGTVEANNFCTCNTQFELSLFDFRFYAVCMHGSHGSLAVSQQIFTTEPFGRTSAVVRWKRVHHRCSPGTELEGPCRTWKDEMMA